MIQKPRDYDSISAFGESSFTPLPKGGYIVRITDIREETSQNGGQMIHFMFDIADGEFANYFSNLFESRRRKNLDPNKTVKWPFEGQMWVPIQDYEDASKMSRKFKGLCTALKDSGTEPWLPNDAFNMQGAKGATIGMVFQRVEREYQGKKIWETVPWACRSVGAIDSGDYYVPDDKPYVPKDNGYGYSQPNYGQPNYSQPSYQQPQQSGSFNGFNNQQSVFPDPAGNFSATDDGVPF